MANTLMILNTWYIASQFNELQLWLKYICTRREISGDEQHLYEDLLTAFESFPFINNNSCEKHHRNDGWLSHSGVAVASHSSYYVFTRKSRQVCRFLRGLTKTDFIESHIQYGSPRFSYVNISVDIIIIFFFYMYI